MSIARSCPVRLAIGLTLALSIIAQDHQSVTTSDGSQFLLIRFGTTPIIHWVVMTPAGLTEDPVGFEGASHAAARASVNGTSELGSRDWKSEREILDDVTQLERAVAQLQSLESPVTPELASQLLAARQRASSASLPTAWRDDLAGAPATDLFIHETSEASLLTLTTTAEGIPSVAKLLWARREDAQLRELYRHVTAVRQELQQQNLLPLANLRNEVLGLAYAGSSRGRTAIALGHTIPRDVALRVYREVQRPERSFHVLLGGFDFDDVTAVLDSVFAKTELPPSPVPPRERRTGRGERFSRTPSERQAIAVAFRLTADVSHDTLDVLVEWLAGEEQGYLIDALRRRGLRDVAVRGQAPFPGNTVPGMLLIEAWQEQVPDEDDPDIPLEATVHELLEAAQAGPKAANLDRAVQRVQARRLSRLATPRSAALYFAIECGIRKRMPEDVARDSAGEIDGVSVEAVTALAKRVLGSTDRTIVVMERDR